MNAPKQDYTELAETYDAKRFEDKKGQFNARADAYIIRKLLRKTDANLCLDIPAGTGRVFDYVAGEQVQIIGCDYTFDMLKKAKHRLNGNHPGLVRGDAAQLPFADHTFDCVICLRFFHLFRPETRAPFAQEFYRVVKPQGYLICSFTNGWYGGGLNWIQKLMGQRKIFFLMPGEIRRLFPNWSILEQYGNFFPWQRIASSRGPKVEGLLLKMNSNWPMNYLCYERFLLMQRM